MPSRDISRAPFHIRYSRKSDFEPNLVSIGPHFYKKDYPTDKDLKHKFTRYFLEMETASIKNLKLRGLVERLDDPDNNLEQDIYEWYGGRDKIAPKWKKLLRVLVRDSCFIIRIMVYLSREANHMLSLGVNVEMLRFELLLLENQIPMFFLKKVYDFLDTNKMLPPKLPVSDPAPNPHVTNHRPFLRGFLSIERRHIAQPTSEQGPIPEPISEQTVLPTSEQGGPIPQPTSVQAPQSISEQDPISQLISEQTPLPPSEQGTVLQPKSEQTPELTSSEAVPVLQPTSEKLSSEEGPIEQPISEQTPPPTAEEGTLLQPTSEESTLPQQNLSSEQSRSLQTTAEQTHNLNQFLEELKPFICLDMPWKFNDKPISKLPDHLLDLYWKWCLPSAGLDQDLYSRNHHENTCDHADSSWANIHIRSNADKRIQNACALETKAGVTFVKRKHEEGFGVEFRNGILRLPHLKLDQNQTILLVNLIAFEEFKPSQDRVLTSYILLLDGLINTKKDVELLHSCGVITNKLKSVEKVSAFFNDIGNICKVNYDKHYCKDQFSQLNNYYQSKWSRHCAILRHEHFKSPWAVISVLAGTSLLIMSGLQTGYNIYGFYHHHHHNY